MAKAHETSLAGLVHIQPDDSHPSTAIEIILRQYLTPDEEIQIYEQFRGAWSQDRQVLWSGMLRSQAQKWADEHGMQTLTTAMGPLMNPGHPKCPQHKKTPKAWSKYVHGASVVFAWYISLGNVVTVLSQPPPQRFNPSNGTSYQTLEEPIVTGKIGSRSVTRVQVVHPTVTEAANICYEMWPKDMAYLWIESFGKIRVVNPHWRKTKDPKVDLS